MSALRAVGDGDAEDSHGALAAAAAPMLAGNKVLVRATDPVGGGTACAIEDCPCSSHKFTLCTMHFARWTTAGRPDLGSFQPGPLPGGDVLNLGVLPIPLRWEIAFGIARAREVPDPPQLVRTSLRSSVDELAHAGITSLLLAEETRWPPRRRYAKTGSGRQTTRLKLGFLTFTIDQLDDLAGTDGREAELNRDIWRLRRLGVTGPARGWAFDFTGISQPWLRSAVQHFLRWRLDTEHSPSGMNRDLLTLTRLSRAVTDVAGPAAQPAQFTRTVIERLLSVLVEDGLTPNGRSIALCSVTRFFALARQHGWLPGVPPRTGVYSEDFPPRTPLPPRGLTEYVMAQLEDSANLDKLTDPRWRVLIPLLIATGLRVNDALRLEPDCLVYDHQHAPYLRYFNHKMKREALLPVSEELASSIATRRREAREQFSVQSCLFPRVMHNPAGTHPTGKSTFSKALQHWIADCNIHDETGNRVHVSAHQFRHTLGTRLINNDVPQEVVRKILDHTSTEMTAHYARLHDTTVREHWERARRVDIHGEDVTLPADSPLADAEWAKHHLSRATMALPNGYCGLPLQQSCPHSNACLTCPVFITTPEFLPQHRAQLTQTQAIIERAQHRGQLRLAEMNQRTAGNLLNIITSLEADTTTASAGGDDAS